MELSKFAFEDYWNALDGVGDKMKELVLERAAHDDGIEFPELKRLVDKDYPDSYGV